jgi:hypothetical protein
VALANIDRLPMQVEPPPVDTDTCRYGHLSFQSAQASGESKLSTILSAGSEEQQSEPLSGSVWGGSYGTIGAAAAEESQDEDGRQRETERDRETERQREQQHEVQIEAVTVEVADCTAVGPEEEEPADSSGGTKRQQRRANANGFQVLARSLFLCLCV